MKPTVRSLTLATVVLAGALCLTGCASNPRDRARNDLFDHQYDAFGRAMRQDIAAQVADPDPAWKNTPAPPTDGRRVEEAMKTYHKPPATTSTTTTFTLPGAQ